MASKENIHALPDGTVVRLRPLTAADRRKLLAGFERFSAESRYRRFFSPTPRLTHSMLDRLFDVDGNGRVAIGAERLRLWVLPTDGLAIARFTRLPEEPEAAEMAISVVDAMHGRGLGSLLLFELARVARSKGIARFVAWVQPDNEPMKALIHKLDPHARSRAEDGLLYYELSLPDPAAVAAAGRPHRRPTAADLVGWLGDAVRQLLPGARGGRVFSPEAGAASRAG